MSVLTSIAGIPISIHASAKEATQDITVGGSLYLVFQSTPPRRRRLGIHCRCVRYVNFNPRLREGGDFLGLQGFKRKLISIHASAKEATWVGIYNINQVRISIHASAKEATH